MNPNRLVLFYQDELTREDFKNFQLKVLEEMILDDCYNNDSKNGLALRLNKELIERSYKRLDELFGEDPKPVINNLR